MALIKRLKLCMLALLILTLCGMAQSASAQNQGFKFGFIDLSVIYKEGVVFQNVQKEIRSMFQDKADKLQEMAKTWEEESNQFKLQRELLPAETVKERRNKLQEELNNILQMKRDEAENFQQAKMDKLEPLIAQLKKIVQEVAQQEGYQMVFSRDDIIYGDPSFDITQKVLARLNKQ